MSIKSSRRDCIISCVKRRGSVVDFTDKEGKEQRGGRRLEQSNKIILHESEKMDRKCKFTNVHTEKREGGRRGAQQYSLNATGERD